jgi:tetratricopeptide (TPR) repeat protein
MDSPPEQWLPPVLQALSSVRLSSVSQIKLGDVLLAQGDRDGALAAYRKALEISERLAEQDPQNADWQRFLLVSHNRLGNVLLAQGDGAGALAALRKALELSSRVLGDEHPDVAKSLSALGAVYKAQGNYAEAEPLMRQALELRRRALGEAHPDYATSLDNLAVLYHAMGDYAAAEPLMRQALELRRRTLGEEQHPDVAQSLNNLAESAGRTLGEEQHPDVAQSLNNLAELDRAKGNYVQEHLSVKGGELGLMLLSEAIEEFNAIRNMAESGISSVAQLGEIQSRLEWLQSKLPTIERSVRDPNLIETLGQLSGAVQRDLRRLKDWSVLPAFRKPTLRHCFHAAHSMRLLRRARGSLIPASDTVDCAVFARPTVSQGEIFLVQVFTYLPEQADVARRLAREFDERSQQRGFKSLETEVERGSKLMFHLVLPSLNIEDPVQSLTWHGEPQSIQFQVTVPEDRRPGDVIGTVTVSQDSVPIGHIKFKIRVTTRAENQRDNPYLPMPLGDLAHCYRKAFVSYASRDRTEVLKRVQMLRLLRIRFFQDLLHLEPGDVWEDELYRCIDESDLFLLFWSTSARQSEWVMKEVRYALKRKGGDDYAPPEIIPVVIEGPPPPEPPEELAHLHFSDYLLYFMAAAAR